MICVGTASPDIARLACQRTRLELRKLGYAANIRSFKIENTVMNYELGHRVHVARFYADFQDLADYDPAFFPGCSCEMPDLGVGALVFHSGKIIVMGFARDATGYEAVRRLRALLARYATAEVPSATITASPRRTRQEEPDARRARRGGGAPAARRGD